MSGALRSYESAALTDGGEIEPTAAWEFFCARNPKECAVNLAEPAVVKLDTALWKALRTINSKVNRAIKPITDQQHWGTGDRWDYPADGYGDCEDIQIEKRRDLVALGVPARALRMAMVINQEGEGHAVLIVRSDRGDYVLDNRINAILPWYQTGYTWVKREGDGDRFWVSLGGIKAPVETAAKP